MKIKLLSLFLLLLTTNLFSQSQDIGISSYYTTVNIQKSSQDKCNIDFFKQKLKNDNLNYDYSLFEKDTGLCLTSDIIPFQLSITYDRLNTHNIKWDYKLYISFIYHKQIGINYYHDGNLINDTLERISAHVDEYSKDIYIGSIINFILFERKFLEIYLSPDFGIGMTLSNKIDENVYSMKYTHDAGFLAPIGETNKRLVYNTYRAKPCGLINLGALLGVKIPIYKKWGIMVEYGKTYLFEHTFNGPDIFKTTIFLGGGIYYKFNEKTTDQN